MTTSLPNPTPVRRSGLTAAAKRAAIVASILLPILAPHTPSALAQPMRDRSPSAPPPGAVSLDLAGELELGILIDLISDRLGINIVSSSQAESKKIRIRAPESIPDAAGCPVHAKHVQVFEGLKTCRSRRCLQHDAGCPDSTRRSREGDTMGIQSPDYAEDGESGHPAGIMMSKTKNIIMSGFLTITGFVTGSIAAILPAVVIYRNTSMWMPFDPFPALMALGSSIGVLVLFLVAAYDGKQKLNYICIAVIPCVAWGAIMVVLTKSFNAYRMYGLVIEIVVMTLIYICVKLIVQKAGFFGVKADTDFDKVE